MFVTKLFINTNYKKMKKTVLICSLIMFLLSFGSSKPHCDAYGNKSPETNEYVEDLCEHIPNVTKN